jgi:hypothetical protein
MWHIAMPGAGAIHLINGGPWLAFGAICPAEGKGAGIVRHALMKVRVDLGPDQWPALKRRFGPSGVS